MKVLIRNSDIKCYHEFHVSLHKDLEMLILATPILLLTIVILQWPYARLKVYYWGRKVMCIERTFTTGDWLF